MRDRYKRPLTPGGANVFSKAFLAIGMNGASIPEPVALNGRFQISNDCLIPQRPSTVVAGHQRCGHGGKRRRPFEFKTPAVDADGAASGFGGRFALRAGEKSENRSVVRGAENTVVRSVEHGFRFGLDGALSPDGLRLRAHIEPALGGVETADRDHCVPRPARAQRALVLPVLRRAQPTTRIDRDRGAGGVSSSPRLLRSGRSTRGLRSRSFPSRPGSASWPWSTSRSGG